MGVLVLEDIVVALVLTFLADRTGYAGFAASLVLAATYLAAARFLALLLVRHMAALSDELALLSAFAATVGTAMLFACLDASGAVGAFLCGVVSAGLGFGTASSAWSAPSGAWRSPSSRSGRRRSAPCRR